MANADYHSGKSDELIGLWENDLDDGSGLHAIWGWSYQFNADGTGLYSYWDKSQVQDQNPFVWERLSENSIRTRFLDTDEWTVIEYDQAIVDAPYAGKLIRLTDVNYVPDDFSKVGFWDSYGAIFRYLR